MTFNPQGIVDALASHAAASGYFERVNEHEPKSAPGNGISGAVWVQKIEHIPARSGLAATTGGLTMSVRVYTSMFADPPDAIDPNLLLATNALIQAYSANFTLGGIVTAVDLLGAWSQGLFADAGYVDIDRKLYRIMTINVPLVIDDLWPQVA